MDNMRHLSTSLPRARRTPPQELLSDFKAAALSVTNLYKTAASAQVQSRAAGYQNALEDLLTFLDSENLGLMDGEGWRVRQWATGRLDESTPRQTSEDDDEVSRGDIRETRSSSPESQRKTPIPSQSIPRDELASGSSPQTRVASEPPTATATATSMQIQQQQQPQPQPQPQPQTAITSTARPPHSEFTFTSRLSYPEKEATGMEVDSSTTGNAPTSMETVRILPRPSRNRSNHNNRQRTDGRSTLNFNLGTGAGNKRKNPYQDFFDISGISFDSHDRKDGGGRGGKRGRFA